ncbi:MAG: helix-turn-helix domain-containing protein [bacterium]|nr:helix-turn-helix domain-containing protein [bacterium]
MNSTEQMLTQFGLRPKETALYLASLSLGSVSIADLAKKSGLKRPTAYLIVEELLQKEFLESIPRGKKLYYKPKDPEKLKERIEIMRRALDVSFGGLKKLYEQQHIQPKIAFYDNRAGIYTLYERAFRSKEIWALFSPEKFYEVFSQEDIQHFFRLLDRQNGKIYDIFENNKRGRQVAAEPHRFASSDIRFLPKGANIATDTLVFENAVVFISFDTLIGILIEDKSIAATVKLMLQTLWEKCELLTP